MNRQRRKHIEDRIGLAYRLAQLTTTARGAALAVARGQTDWRAILSGLAAARAVERETLRDGCTSARPSPAAAAA